MKLPKVGENFYWEGIDGEVHEDICMKIEQKDNPDVETMYFQYRCFEWMYGMHYTR